MKLDKKFKKQHIGSINTCSCKFCQRTRKIQDIAKNISKEDRDWLMNFYNYVVETEEELDIIIGNHGKKIYE